MSKKYKYDIAISFAEDDVQLAEDLHECLESYSFQYKTYFYKKKQGEQIGKKLHKIIQQVYGGESAYAIVLVSKFYDQREWPQREWEVIEDERERRKNLYRILISIDGTILNGMDKKELHIPSDNSVERIAMIIHEAIQKSKKPQFPWKLITISSMLILFILALASGKMSIGSTPPFLSISIPAKSSDSTFQKALNHKDSTETGESGLKVLPKEIDTTGVLTDAAEKKSRPYEAFVETDLILTRSEKYEGRNIYVNGRQTAVFREYIITIPGLKLDDKITIGTDDSQEFILTITNTHLENESFRYYIE